MAHVYDWARSRGYWTRDDSRVPTHLLLDGGKLCIPDEFHGSFLNSYAASLARCPDRRPCVVELRTPVFKLFVDLDTRYHTLETAAHARSNGIPDLVKAMTDVVSSITETTVRALVCASSAPKMESADAWKMGFHIVWPDVRVNSRTALHVRQVFLAQLPSPETFGLKETWETIIDKAVYKANGLRMPWSAKGKGDDRFYELVYELNDRGYVPCTPTTVSGVREALHVLSIRTFLLNATLDVQEAASDEDTTPSTTTSLSLMAYSDVLDKVAAALPVEFLGQKFTGIVSTDHCFMIRSTARYCINLGRAHRTNNVYFMLTKKGVCQRCFCRCETTEGRMYGMCKDFSSQYWKLPDDAMRAFFPDVESSQLEDAHAKSHSLSAMPSRVGKTYLSLDKLESRSRAQYTKRRKKA